MKAATISILGCGWYGLPAGRLLVSKGYQVKGSVRSPERINLLSEQGIEPYLIDIKEDGITGSDTFFSCDILIVAFPPSVRKSGDKGYLEKIKLLTNKISLSRIPQVLFISSTSVYGDCNAAVDETTIPNPDTTSGEALLKAENTLRGEPSFNTTILRFAGLVGPGRDPGRFLAGKKNIPNGDAPVNLAHLTDCIGITEKIIATATFGHIFNICSPDHPTRKDFYTQAAIKEGFELPEFSGETEKWKIVNSIKIPALLSWHFSVEHWMDYLEGNPGTRNE